MRGKEAASGGIGPVRFIDVDSKEGFTLQPKRKPRGKPFAKGNKIGPRFPKGKSGNPGGLPGVNLSERIARTVLAQFEPEAVEGLGKKLSSGDIQVFRELAERADGKLKDVHEHQIGPVEHTIRFGDGKSSD